MKTSESSLKHHGRAVSPWGCQSARPSSAADGPGALQIIQQALSAFASPSHISPRRPRAVRFSVPPGAEFLSRAPSFFRPLFRSAQKWPPASKRVTPGAPRESPKHRNPGNMASRTGVRKKGWKKLPKSVFFGKLDMQSVHACAVQIHFFVFALRPEK